MFLSEVVLGEGDGGREPDDGAGEGRDGTDGRVPPRAGDGHRRNRESVLTKFSFAGWVWGGFRTKYKNKDDDDEMDCFDMERTGRGGLIVTHDEDDGGGGWETTITAANDRGGARLSIERLF